ncbi:unnamed protein product, partial [marine sediment metagenome]
MAKTALVVKSRILAIAILINLSKNSYILSLRKVTLQPTGISFLTPKLDIDLFARVMMGFCPL